MTGEIKLPLHTDTLFESILNDGFFAVILALLFLSIIILVYRHFRRKKQLLILNIKATLK